MNHYYKLLKQLNINPLTMHFAASDDDVSDVLTNQIAERDIQYTKILQNHAKLTKSRGICKEIHKWLFFWMIVAVTSFGVYYIYKILNKIIDTNNIDDIIRSIPIIVTSIVSLVSAIIAVPLTIAKFLFNEKEDDNITALIQHTQEHDSTGINVFKERFLKRSSKKRESNIPAHTTTDDLEMLDEE